MYEKGRKMKEKRKILFIRVGKGGGKERKKVEKEDEKIYKILNNHSIAQSFMSFFNLFSFHRFQTFSLSPSLTRAASFLLL